MRSQRVPVHYRATMSTFVLNGLVKRHADLMGEAEAIRTRLDEISAALLHPDATILLVDPAFDLAAVRPRRHTADDAYYARPHARIVLEILRDAGKPLATAEIKHRVMAMERLNARDPRLRQETAKRVSNALNRQRMRGTVRSESGDRGTVLGSLSGRLAKR